MRNIDCWKRVLPLLVITPLLWKWGFSNIQWHCAAVSENIHVGSSSTWISYPAGVPGALRGAAAQGFLLGLKWWQIKHHFLLGPKGKGGWAVSKWQVFLRYSAFSWAAFVFFLCLACTNLLNLPNLLFSPCSLNCWSNWTTKLRSQYFGED